MKKEKTTKTTHNRRHRTIASLGVMALLASGGIVYLYKAPHKKQIKQAGTPSAPQKDADTDAYTKEGQKLIALFEKKKNKALTQEEKDKLLNAFVKERIEKEAKKRALGTLFQQHKIEEMPKIKDILTKVKKELEDKFDKDLEAARQKILLLGLKQKIEDDISTSQKEQIRAEIEKMMQKEKEVTFSIFMAKDPKHAERVKSALDGESADKRQSSLDSIALSQGNEKIVPKTLSSLDLSNSPLGKKILDMRPGESQILDLEKSVAVVLCLKKEALSTKEAQEHAINERVAKELSSQIQALTKNTAS